MLRSLTALSLVLSTPAVPQTVEQSPIPLIVCRVTNGWTLGSAFRVGPQYLITAAHVISSGSCTIDGQPVKVVYRSHDFAILEDKRAGNHISVDCGGYRKDHEYVAVGHARGLAKLTYVNLTGTGEHYSDVPSLSVLTSVITVQPGQSGGPIIDPDTMKVVGEVNTGDWERGLSGSIALKDTPICGGGLV